MLMLKDLGVISLDGTGMDITLDTFRHVQTF